MIFKAEIEVTNIEDTVTEKSLLIDSSKLENEDEILLLRDIRHEAINTALESAKFQNEIVKSVFVKSVTIQVTAVVDEGEDFETEFVQEYTASTSVDYLGMHFYTLKEAIKQHKENTSEPGSFKTAAITKVGY
ncbi:hypothetical protein IC619_015195 [Hazenella sp. IB182353]|uniref:hypothetical protein n=1 Tax=Polycladospora coralii TaxID=2771432 RepID=UPI001747CCDE|nr:hypothetical protein [Polycladospora coralii]MBS7531817.1 hypothetical protein [Polycladospora coralii]